MGVDYYRVLRVSRDASASELKKAYKKLAMKWHPDKHTFADKNEADSKFKQISEAYDVLTHPHKRQIYDSTGQFCPDTRDAQDIFAQIFGHGEGREALQSKMLCTLEELYKGSNRKIKISKIALDQFGKPKTVEEVLEINIKPGWKKGTKITFPEKGNHEPGTTPGDLIFVIDEKPHSVFKRDGNDLVMNQKISLLDALTGKTLNVPTLDGRNITVPIIDIVKPGQELTIQNEGMPISKEPGKKGNLRIKFNIKFPSRLSSEQKSDLRRVLGRTADSSKV